METLCGGMVGGTHLQKQLNKELIEYIWRWNDPTQGYNIVGFEYWTGVYGPDKAK